MKETSPIFIPHYPEQIKNLVEKPELLNDSYFVTLRHAKTSTQKTGYFDFLTDSDIYSNWQYFKNFLHNMLFGTNHKRKRKSIQHLTVQHNHSTNRFLTHIHSILIKPKEIILDDFKKIVPAAWSKTRWGTTGKSFAKKDMFNLQKVYSDGVIHYQFDDQKYYESLLLP